MRKTCAATLAVVDDAIKSIVDNLKEVNMYENTIIIYSSDNGGPPNGTNNNMMNNWPLRSGKGSCWEGGIRAASFIHAPFILKELELVMIYFMSVIGINHYFMPLLVKLVLFKKYR